MKYLEISLMVLYAMGMVFILFYCTVQLTLLITYWKRNKKVPKIPEPDQWPMVTVQLPIFNEKYVVERLIDAVAQFDYPWDKLEIQLLDDSTDETLEITRAKQLEWQRQDLNIKLIHRTDRSGYKAGALQEGLEVAKGKFIAIFDADFLPKKDFLKKMIPQFVDEQVGLVQSGWGHLNRNYSILTKLQALALDAHFSIEQAGRNAAGVFINFNGTGGVWRKSCIQDAGGWQSDTLTEDLDLSYRAQLKGWRFKFTEEVVSPAELPVAMNAIKTQQFRWNKGGAEVARKMLPDLFSSGFSNKIKLHGFFHLLNTSIYFGIFLTAVISVPLLLIKANTDYPLYFTLISLFMMSLLFIAMSYFTAFSKHEPAKGIAFLKFLMRFPVFLAFSMGLSLFNAHAVFEGWIGKKSAFIRTPKFNIINNSQKWIDNKYLTKKVEWISIGEVLLTIYFLVGIFLSFQLNDFALLPFHIMLFCGFGAVSFYTIKHAFAPAN